MPELSPTIIGALITATAALVAALITAWRKSGGGGPQMTATGNSGPVNQQIIDQSSRYTIEHHRTVHHSETPQARPAAATQSETDPWALMAASLAGGLLVVWLMATQWQRIAVTVTAVVACCLLVTAWSWRSWRTLAASTRWLSGMIVALSALVIWATMVIPSGFGPVKSLPDIATATALGGGSISAALAHLNMETMFAYVLRLMGLAMLLFLLVMTTAEGWGLTMLTRELRRVSPRARRVRTGSRLAGLFALSPGTIVGLSLTTLLALAIIHPASLGWILDRMHQMSQSR